MKLGISYNLWNGEELLRPSILSIRNSVDYISVVYQDKSNHGNKKDNLEPFLESLFKDKLIDELSCYNPNLSLNPKTNELIKRNIGLSLSRSTECTHHLSIDVDEFYQKEQFDRAKEYIEQNNIKASVCQLQSYYKYPTLQIIPPEIYYVTFIFKIVPKIKFIYGTRFPVLVDPSRRLSIFESFKIFQRKELEMHHMSYVRNDIRLKVENASSYRNFAHKIEELVSHYENFKEGNQAMFAGKHCVYHNLQKVNNQFNINMKIL
ncbi:hypothetical protein ES703_44271 [subsurface metagenome]